MNRHEAERRSVISAARRTVAFGLTHGTSGNVSVRIPGGLAITPSGLPYDDLQPADIVVLNTEGVAAPGELRLPSSEWPMHAAIYRGREEVAATVHVHSPDASALSCLRQDLPAFHYMVAIAGGDSVRCAPYAVFGSQAIADRAVEALTDRTACLLANHGLVAVGPSLDAALAVATEVEFLAGIYLKLLSIGRVEVLSSVEMNEVRARFDSYGQRP